MRIRLTHIDGKLPNLALMKLAHYHRQRGDSIYFTKKTVRTILEPEYDVVYGSTIFNSSYKKVKETLLCFPNAIIGGTGYDLQRTVEDTINYSKGDYEKYDYSIYPDFKYSIGYTHRGCRGKCKFCVVPTKEGNIRSINSIYDIYRDKTEKNIILLDNDFLGQPAWKERCLEIIEGKFKVCINQGINVRLLTEEQALLLSNMCCTDFKFSTKRIYTAWDNTNEETSFIKGVYLLFNHNVSPKNIMVFMLCGYNKKEEFEDVYYRFKRISELGMLPYPMVYGGGKDYTLYKRFQRWVVGRYYQIVEWETYKNLSIFEYYTTKNKIKQDNLF